MHKGLWAIITMVICSVLFLSSCYKTNYDFDIASCEVDDDCVRQASCCDCGYGSYINKEYYEPKACSEECDCVTELSIGMCINSTCEAIPLDEEYCDDAQEHRLGDTWMEDGKPCTCLRGRVIDCGTTQQKQSKEEARQALEEYRESIDYSCITASDCEIKDVHNCCGYFPKCVNTDFEVKPEQVTEWCIQSESASICGYPTINRCECQEGTCVGII